MTVYFTTQNSSYEVDQVRRRIRRLEGQNPPTPRQQQDGEWQSYLRISALRIGWPVVVVWDVQGDRLRATTTGPIKTIASYLH